MSCKFHVSGLLILFPILKICYYRCYRWVIVIIYHPWIAKGY